MIRVYFDLNIYTYLRQGKERDRLNNIIKSNRNKLLFPYSPAHLQDLQRGFSQTEKSKALTYRDLEFIQEVSQNHCLYQDYQEQKVIPRIINTVEFFNQISEDKTTDEFNLDDYFLSDNEDISDLFAKFSDQLKSFPTGINLKDVDNIPEKYESIKTLFQSLREENNFYNLLKDVLKVLSQPEKHSKIYTEVRNSSIEDMKIDTNPENWGNAFDYLNKFILKTTNQTLQEMVENNLKIRQKGKTPSLFDYFTSYYISLDTFGYYRDQKMPNLIADATHAYYGAFCDFFITEDDNTYQKAKAIYKNFKIATKVCKANEFPTVFYKTNELANVDKNVTIAERITDIIRYSVILMNSVDDELNPVSVYEIKYRLIDYFDRMQISYFKDFTGLSFYKKKRNYSDFLFWSEIKSIVDKIVDNFGIDDKLRMNFDERDQEDLNQNDNWRLRIWERNNILTEIIYDYESVGLMLRITMKNNI